MCNARYLITLARTRNSEELPSVGATENEAGCHLVPFGHLVLYSPEEVGSGTPFAAVLVDANKSNVASEVAVRAPGVLVVAGTHRTEA
jgi:hypothetical protein